MMEQMKKHQGLFGKRKGIREMKDALAGGEGDPTAMAPGVLPPGMMPPGLAPPSGPGGPGKKKIGPSLDERRKKRKQERQRRKNSRRK